MIIHYRARRGGEWLPEDRLRVTMFGIALMVPFSVLLSGFITRYVPGNLGIVLNLACLFVNGLGVSVLASKHNGGGWMLTRINITDQVDFVLGPSAAYNVDIMHSKSAEIMAANKSVITVIQNMTCHPLCDAREGVPNDPVAVACGESFLRSSQRGFCPPSTPSVSSTRTCFPLSLLG